jgi:hypothetical protein
VEEQLTVDPEAPEAVRKLITLARPDQAEAGPLEKDLKGVTLAQELILGDLPVVVEQEEPALTQALHQVQLVVRGLLLQSRDLL